ncbi:MAG TPA: hypothetical protein VG890_13910 [Puia sp.]|nr:hypothetical protein [Puia sp.]
MKQPKIDLGKEYLLPHVILVALRKTGIAVTGQAGNRVSSLSHCHLPLDVLMHQISNEDGNWYRLDSGDVALTIEALKANGDIQIIENPIPINILKEEIRLTEMGLSTLSNKLYLKQYFNELREERIYNSTLRTNLMMIFFTLILAVSAGIEIFKFFMKN